MMTKIGEEPMSLIEKLQKMRITSFYKKSLLSAATKIRQRGITFFPMGPDRESASYFEPREREGMTKDHFTFPGPISEKELLRGLKQKWEDEGLSELAEIIPEMETISQQLQKNIKQREDLDPFIYRMY